MSNEKREPSPISPRLADICKPPTTLYPDALHLEKPSQFILDYKQRSVLLTLPLKAPPK